MSHKEYVVEVQHFAVILLFLSQLFYLTPASSTVLSFFHSCLNCHSSLQCLALSFLRLTKLQLTCVHGTTIYMWRLIMPRSSYSESGRLSIPNPHKAQCRFSHYCMVPLIFSCAFLIVVQFSGRFTPEWSRSDAFISNIQLARENIVCVVQSQLICFHLNFLQLHFQEGLLVKTIWERAHIAILNIVLIHKLHWLCLDSVMGLNITFQFNFYGLWAIT